MPKRNWARQIVSKATVSKTVADGWLGAMSAIVLLCSVASFRATAQETSSSTTASKPATATVPHKRKTKQAASRRGKRKTVARGQQKIDPERAQEIQQALIREHYLSGSAAGTWNQASEDAMRRYQADHGWQSKTVPDSRALISLGLGPSHDHLLNPDSAMTMASQASSAHLSPASSSAAPASSQLPAAAAQPGAHQVQPDAAPASQTNLDDSSRPQ